MCANKLKGNVTPFRKPRNTWRGIFLRAETYPHLWKKWIRSDRITEETLNNDAFSESKQMRTSYLAAEIRRQMSARAARQVEISNSGAASQKKLREAASQLNNRLKN